MAQKTNLHKLLPIQWIKNWTESKHVQVAPQETQIETYEMILKDKQFSEESANNAVERVPIEAGKWVRRLIVVSVLFGVILAPFVTTLMDHPIVVEEMVTKKILWNIHL